MASTSGVAEAATRSLLMSIRRSLIHCCSMYVNNLRSSASIDGRRRRLDNRAAVEVDTGANIGPVLRRRIYQRRRQRLRTACYVRGLFGDLPRSTSRSRPHVGAHLEGAPP